MGDLSGGHASPSRVRFERCSDTARSKDAIRTLGPLFSSQRMVIDYITELYTPACEGGLRWVETAGAAKR